MYSGFPKLINEKIKFKNKTLIYKKRNTNSKILIVTGKLYYNFTAFFFLI